MKESYSFRIDGRLKIIWCDGKTAGFFGNAGSCDLAGKKYYEVITRIEHLGSDAVRYCLKNDSALNIPRYCFRFNNIQFYGDVQIKPLQKKEVEVSISPVATCEFARQLYGSKRLIDIGKIASMLAHGVRNPLNAIKGAVVFLGEKYSDDDTLAEFTAIMEEEISRLDTFISNFLSTSLSGACLQTDLNDLIHRVEALTSLQAKAANIKAQYFYGELPGMLVDGFQLEQAILNVINNAIEAMGPGGKLQVSTLYQKNGGPDEPGCVIIEVADSGPGISGKLQGLPSGNNESKGFGLFITREILQCYGGRLEIKSQKDAGTAVRLYLPVGSLK